MIWYRGKAELHTPRRFRDPWGVETWRWTVAAYEPYEDAVRFIPTLAGGRAYCQVDTDRQDPDVFIGNPLVCDGAEVFISVIKVGKGRCEFEVNNPTDGEIACTIRPARGFELTGRWERRMTLPAGGSRRESAESSAR